MVSSMHIYVSIISPEFTQTAKCLLQDVEPEDDHEFIKVLFEADAGCLCLMSLRFDLELYMYAGNERWKRFVACCDYGLDPSLTQD